MRVGHEAAPAVRRALLPQWLTRPGLVPVLPDLPELRFQAMHSYDAAAAFRLALLRPVRGVFNLAVDPVVDVAELARLLRARPVRDPVPVVRGGLAAAWRMHLVTVLPDLFDAVLGLQIMDTAREREELGWQARHGSLDAVGDFLEGIRAGAGRNTPPLSPRTSGPGRMHEFGTGVGTRA